jgi:hypothetical protein
MEAEKRKARGVSLRALGSIATWQQWTGALLKARLEWPP